jgi:GntR family transcriptional regulator
MSQSLPQHEVAHNEVADNEMSDNDASTSDDSTGDDSTSGVSEDESASSRPSSPVCPQVSPSRRSDVARRIADLIRSDLHAGRLGEQLPYEWDLPRRYNGSRGATREALKLLSDEGVLRRLPGVGTLRRTDRTALRLNQPMTTISTVDAESKVSDEPVSSRIRGTRMQVETLAHEVLDAPAAVAEALEIAVGEDVLFTEALIRVDGTPHRLRSSWIPISRAPGIESVSGFPPDLLRELLSTELSIRRFVIEAAAADAAVAALLEMEPGMATLVNERIMATADGLPIEFGFTRHRGDRSYFYASVTD